MKSRLGILLSLLLMCVLTAGAMAQTPTDTPNPQATPSGARGRHGGMDHFFRSKLQATDDQMTRLQPLVKEMQDQNKTLRQAYKAKLNSILTPEQQTRLSAMQAARKSARQNSGTPRPGKHRRGLRSLGLSDSQKAQLKAFRQENLPKVKANWQHFRSQVATVLSPQQNARFDQMLQQRADHRKGQRQHRGSPNRHMPTDTQPRPEVPPYQ